MLPGGPHRNRFPCSELIQMVFALIVLGSLLLFALVSGYAISTPSVRENQFLPITICSREKESGEYWVAVTIYFLGVLICTWSLVFT